MTFVHLDGKLLPESEARVSPFDRGFLLGDGVFETLRSDDGRSRRFEAHHARLARSASLVGIPLPETDLAKAIEAVLRANNLTEGPAAVRITLTRGSGGRGTSPAGAGPPTLLVTAQRASVPDELYARGARVIVASHRRAPPSVMDPRIKGTSYLPLVLARGEAELAGADEALLLHAMGPRVVEATSANVFILKNETLATPSLDEGCLDGLTRREVLDLGRDLGLRTKERPIGLDELLGATEAFLTSSVVGILGIVQVGETRVGTGAPGETTQRLRALLHPGRPSP